MLKLNIVDEQRQGFSLAVSADDEAADAARYLHSQCCLYAAERNTYSVYINRYDKSNQCVANKDVMKK